MAIILPYEFKIFLSETRFLRILYDLTTFYARQIVTHFSNGFCLCVINRSQRLSHERCIVSACVTGSSSYEVTSNESNANNKENTSDAKDNN